MNTKIREKSRQTLRTLEAISGEKLTLGGLLLAIREGDELTQVEFACKLGISKQYLCDVEHDRKVVSPQKAAKFATILEYPVSQFVRLALQEALNRNKIPLDVEVYSRAA